jgi:outer membrane lipoprotein-sorting protein
VKRRLAGNGVLLAVALLAAASLAWSAHLSARLASLGDYAADIDQRLQDEAAEREHADRQIARDSRRP